MNYFAYFIWIGGFAFHQSIGDGFWQSAAWPIETGKAVAEWSAKP
jgi:hypothetical protein